MKYVIYDIDKLVGDMHSYLNEYNIRQKEFAKCCNISESKLSRIMNGNTKILTSDTVLKIVGFMNKSVNDYIINTGCANYISNFDIMDLESLSDSDLDLLIGKLKEVRLKRLEDNISRLLSELEINKEKLSALDSF